MDKYMENIALRQDLRYVLEKLEKVIKYGVGSSPDVEQRVLEQLLYNCKTHYKFERRED